MVDAGKEMNDALKEIVVQVLREPGFKDTFPHFCREPSQHVDLLSKPAQYIGRKRSLEQVWKIVQLVPNFILLAQVDIAAQQIATLQIHGLFGNKFPEPPLRRVAVAAPVPYQVKHDFRQRQRWRKQQQAMARLGLQRHALEDGGGHAGARDNRRHGE